MKRQYYILLHTSSSINPDNLSVNPFAVLAGKEAYNTGNINWETDSVKRTPSCSVLKESVEEEPGQECHSYLVNLIISQVLAVRNVLSADLVVHIGLDSTWGNAVYSDLLVTHI